MADLDATLDAQTLALDPAYVFHSWSAQGSLKPLVIQGGSGTRLWDSSGNEYLDFSSQLVFTNIGHQHPRVVEAIKAQADQLTTIAPATANLSRGKAAQRVVEVANASVGSDHFSKVFFTNGGADANENAIRLARLTTGRDKVLSHFRSYHGNTGGAIVATGDWRRMPNEYARGHVHFFGPYLYRSEFWATTPEEESARALHHLRRMIESEGPQTIAAVLIESVPGTAGILVPPPGYLEGVRALCDEFGIVYIADEVMAGFGRTGSWFAFEQHGVTPDLITFAKGVNSGYVPAGGVVVSASIAHAFDERVFPGGLTYSGHPLAMAAIVATIDAMKDEQVVDHAKTVGETAIASGLAALQAKHDVIGEVRGLGVFWAVELVADRATRAPLPAASMAEVKSGLLKRGVIPFVQDNRVHIVPPCVVTADEVATAFAALDETLGSL